MVPNSERAHDVAQRVREFMEKAKKNFPSDLDYVVSLDTTLAVSQGVHEIMWTLGIALVLVITVVFIFTTCKAGEPRSFR